MKTLLISLAFVTTALASQAQTTLAPVPSEIVAGSEVTRFVNHPYNCTQMMGGSDDGDTLPASFNVALDASLKELATPAPQAMSRIHSLCVRKMSELKLGSLN